jgi:hypothetical protein
MTITANGKTGRTSSTKCLVAYTCQSRKPELAALGYMYAGYKLPGEDTVTRGFLFKPHTVLPIDVGFEFEENIIAYNQALKSSQLRDQFYPALDEVPSVAAAQLQEDGIHPDTDRIQDLSVAPRPAIPAPVVPSVNMSVEQLMTYLTPEDQADLKRQLAYTIAAAKCMGVSQAAMWQQATSLAGVHFIPAFDPRYKEALR